MTHNLTAGHSLLAIIYMCLKLHEPVLILSMTSCLVQEAEPSYQPGLARQIKHADVPSSA
jgi:hypothetical protein